MKLDTNFLLNMSLTLLNYLVNFKVLQCDVTFYTFYVTSIVIVFAEITKYQFHFLNCSPEILYGVSK